MGLGTAALFALGWIGLLFAVAAVAEAYSELPRGRRRLKNLRLGAYTLALGSIAPVGPSMARWAAWCARVEFSAHLSGADWFAGAGAGFLAALVPNLARNTGDDALGLYRRTLWP
jgi:hypothetical protein